MILLGLKAENYRNISSCDLTFSKGVNLLYGENAQGKTNALECIYSFARGKSFRGSPDADLIRFGEGWFSSEICFRDREREQTISYRFSPQERKRSRNGVPIRQLTEMIGHFRAVLFYPEHLQMVKGGPAERRAFLNIAISQCYPVYLKLYAEYNRIMENRNCLLKAAQKGYIFDREELETWSESLADRAAKIHLYRRKYIEDLSGVAADLMRDLSGRRENLSLCYGSDGTGETEEELKESYLRRMEETFQREVGAGCSLTGIHRDDMGVEINGISARGFASQGQQRSVVLALKLAEGEVSRKLTGEYPVFLFDDVLSELDERRREYVLSDPGDRQFLMTSCEKEGFDFASVHLIPVSGGNFG